ncbi:MAG: hypothetical protein HOH04_11515 [Rhodospirillaceae bacterium]|nr:hypothetical protein [Rhodospirillaceae bacterium]
MNEGETVPETAVPSKKDWPRTEYGTIDWEPAFEDPEHGLISLVEQAVTADGILACCKVIIHSLFSRQGDAEERVAYERRVNDAMVLSFDGSDVDVDRDDDAIRKDQVIVLLREIKTVRVERADFHITRIKMGIVEGEKRVESADEPDLATVSPDAPPAEDNNISAEDAFIEAMSLLLAGRFEALREDVSPGQIAGEIPPFPVSEIFAQHFDTLVREHFAPAMMTACRPFIVQAEHKEPAERVAFIQEQMEERRSREILWDSWRIEWREKTVEQELPKKPKEEKKGLLSKLKKKKNLPSWQEEPLTMEEWEEEVARIKQANKLAKSIWAKIIAPNDAFQPPDDDDDKLLMNLFARTAGAISKQINAVRQIAEQGGNTGKVFADYQQGKDIDLPLVCACCQRPDLFLEGGMLKNIMRSFPDAMKRERFRLTTRSFGTYM